MKYYIVDNTNIEDYLPKMVEAHGHENVAATSIFDNTDIENPVDTGFSIMQFDSLPTGFTPADGFSATGYTNDEIKLVLETYQAEQIIPRIYDFKVMSDDELQNFDFSLLGLHGYDTHLKGRKDKREYFAPDGNKDKLVVRKSFTDEIVDGKLDHINMVIEWLNTDDTVYMVKTVDITMTEVQKAQHLYERRRRAINYISFFAVGTPLEGYVATLLTAYADEINEYINAGSTAFADAINAETDPTLRAILDTPADPTNGNTVAMGILYNI